MFAPTLQCQVTTCFDLCLIMPPIGEQRKATAGKRKAEDGLHDKATGIVKGPVHDVVLPSLRYPGIHGHAQVRMYVARGGRLKGPPRVSHDHTKHHPPRPQCVRGEKKTPTMPECFDYCHAPCTELLGNPMRECGACDTSFSCHSGADGFEKEEDVDGGSSSASDDVGIEGNTVDVPPMCGILSAADATDHDVLCVKLVHDVPWLGTLTLHNDSVSGTLHSPLPQTIGSGETSWWQVRDGIFWKDTGGGKPSARLDPYTASVWYKARCSAHLLQEDSACVSGTEFIVRVTVALRSFGRVNGKLEGEHIVTTQIAATAAGVAMSQIALLANWTDCVLEASVRLQSGAASASTSPHVTRVSERSVRRAVHPEDAQASWCSTAAANEAKRSRPQSSHLRDGNPAVDMAHAAPVCDQMAQSKAVNTVHIRYFLAQQRAEAELLNATEHQLCEGSRHKSPAFLAAPSRCFSL